MVAGFTMGGPLGPNVLITGTPGTGKTCTSQQIAVSLFSSFELLNDLPLLGCGAVVAVAPVGGHCVPVVLHLRLNAYVD